jgi:hypothetical protein
MIHRRMLPLFLFLFLLPLGQAQSGDPVIHTEWGDPILTEEELSHLPLIKDKASITKMVGTYAECAMACEAIRINPDMTFDHYLSGVRYSPLSRQKVDLNKVENLPLIKSKI